MVRNYKRKTVDTWTLADLSIAVKTIAKGNIKINCAARKYGISRATLYRYLLRYHCGDFDESRIRRVGGCPILTKLEEEVLANLIMDMRTKQGINVSSADIKRICYEYCDTHNIPTQFNEETRLASDDWYYGFMKRHPEVDNRPTKARKDKRCSSEAGSDKSSGPPELRLEESVGVEPVDDDNVDEAEEMESGIVFTEGEECTETVESAETEEK